MAPDVKPPTTDPASAENAEIKTLSMPDCQAWAPVLSRADERPIATSPCRYLDDAGHPQTVRPYLVFYAGTVWLLLILDREIAVWAGGT